MKRLIKQASGEYICLHSINTKSGEPIEFIARLSSNKLYFSIIQEHDFCSSSFYDGPDFEEAFSMYIDILLAFKDILSAENVAKHKSDFIYRANKLIVDMHDYKLSQQHTPYQKQQLFLGNNDF
jgi:hypothetical protein